MGELMSNLISFGEKLANRACSAPDAMAVSCGDATITWSELDSRSNRIAHALAELGVGIGDLITLALPNSIAFIEACWGIWKVGATPQPVSFRSPASELRSIVELANPPLVIALPGVDTGRRRVTVADLLSLSEDESPLDRRVSPVVKAATSGGSTGRPKLILKAAPALTAAIPPNPAAWRFQPGEIAMIPAPLYHNGPFQCALDALTNDVHLVLMEGFDAEACLTEIKRRKVTWIYLVPTMMSRIWRLPHEVRARYDVSTLRTLWHLAAPCPPWLKEAFINWLGPEVIMELYGATDGNAWTEISGTEWLRHRGSVGRPVMGEIRVFDAEGNELPAGEVGDIYTRQSESAGPAYIYRGEVARTLPGGWQTVGDVGWLDGEGYLYLADRRTDMILIGGSNVYPAEIEAAIDAHPLVGSSAVVGLPDEDMGSYIHAIVQADKALSANELLEFLRQHLVTYKLPRSIEFVDFPLRDDAGKVRRSQLRNDRLAKIGEKLDPEPGSTFSRSLSLAV